MLFSLKCICSSSGLFFKSVRLRLLSPKGAGGQTEDYEFSLPSVFARSILTIPWVELGDKVTVQCDRTGYSAGIVFHTKVSLYVDDFSTCFTQGSVNFTQRSVKLCRWLLKLFLTRIIVFHTKISQNMSMISQIVSHTCYDTVKFSRFIGIWVSSYLGNISEQNVKLVKLPFVLTSKMTNNLLLVQYWSNVQQRGIELKLNRSDYQRTQYFTCKKDIG